jgi:type II restriction/modification system DNA methylase subunit YeeA
MSAPSTAAEFVKKWRRIELKERSAAQAHFRDLCHVLGQPTPEDADPKGEWYCFEKGATKTTGGDGWADVWMRQHFGWEYKGKGKDLTAAYAQLQRYAPALENPPLLIVSDMDQIVVHTNWTNTVPQVHPIPLEKLTEPEYLQVLRWAFTDPERLRPGLTTEDVTQRAAGRFAGLAQKLRDRGYDAHRVAHFLNRLVFCLFAEDAGLLNGNVFTRALEATRKRPETAEAMLRDLFRVMHKGGNFGPEYVDWFNGGLFDSDDALPLTVDDIDDVLEAAKLDWSSIEPSIFGTLFERGLDPSKRAQLGAHYTDAGSILRIVNPVIKEPLLGEWATSRAAIKASLEKADTAKAPATRTKARKEAEQTLQSFMHRLGEYRVLDPACGSGNFLYLALQTLKDIEHRAALQAEELGMGRGFTGMNTGVQNVHGIELNAYAAELARLTVWIGEIQWMLRHGVQPTKNPILQPLQTIECRDAVLNDDGTEPEWPTVDAIIGNPPFLGGKMMRNWLGDRVVDGLFDLYRGRVPAEADLVTYWFEKARAQIEGNPACRVGLVATNSIRGGANRRVLESVCRTATIYEAWSDEDWVNEGAAVRVSIICFSKNPLRSLRLDGQPVPTIHPDLTGGSANLTSAARLDENLGIAFMGDTKGGAFDVPGTLARKMLLESGNPNGKPNSEVLRPWINGLDVTRRLRDFWIIDFGWDMDEAEASMYERPFKHIAQHVRPERANNRRESYRRLWWRHVEPRPGMWRALAGLSRCLVTPTVAKHRLFRWSHPATCPDHQLIVLARDDDATLGILHSRFHEVWSLRQGTSLEDRPRYTPTTTFETFPFPEGLTPNLKPTEYTNPHAAEIGAIAVRLNELRENWLNPPEWTERVPEVVPGYPDRIVAKPGCEEKLKKRTLTNLYNERPAWLANVHRELDAAVAKAYGWTDYSESMSDEEILGRLLKLNLERSAD